MTSEPGMSGFGDEEAYYAKLRQRMVDQQLASRGIHDPKVLAAMLEVPRHRFVPKHLRSDSYEDCPLPIGFGQTISQPLTVAWMVQALKLSERDRVLEVGAGSGYGAAVLSRVAGQVFSVERIPELAERAAKQIAELGYDNCSIHLANGTLGLPSHAPFDAIVVTAGSNRLPPPYRDQLNENGRILIPIGESGGGQQMMRYTLRDGELLEENLGLFAFVPLIGKHGWQPPTMSALQED